MHANTPNLSYWEYKSWFSNVDFTIIGSGITGLNCALALRKRHPRAKILILERGSLPQGASTKNAGFACFGSLSELIADLQTHSEAELLELVKMRVNGLALLRKTLGDAAMGYKNRGGYELFLESNEKPYAVCLAGIKKINAYLRPIFNTEIFSAVENSFGFQNIKPQLIFNKAEGQLDTGKVMQNLLHKAHTANILILNSSAVTHIEERNTGVRVLVNGMNFKTNKVCIATNGFASRLGVEQVKPARNQVLVTKPIKGLQLKGTFHLDEGYTYFRNIDNRILLGGGRNLDLKGEQTDAFGTTSPIQAYLENMLSSTILPHTAFEIEHRWSGILGVGAQKRPILKQLSDNVYCGVRLGGMGIAIGSIVGQQLAELLDN